MKKLVVASALSVAIGQAYACASCGCSLNTDYGTQGMSNAGGWTLDLRYDYVNQNQLRSGTGKISNAAAAATNKPDGDYAEVEGYTKNKYLTASLDYNDGEKWGVTAHLPYISRDHMTYGTTLSDPSATDNYQSKTSGLGDVKLIGRYFGWADEKDWGLQFGLKLPTGRFDGVDSTGMTAVDPGLQLGTKTTDLILGAYKFGQLGGAENWGYFASGQYQRALNSSNIPDSLVNPPTSAPAGTYRPGNSVNLNFGLNYHGYDQWTPTLQFNYIDKKVDSGSAADTYATGGKLLYVTPGAIVSMTEQTKLLLNLQLPLYQNVNGIQLTPKYVASIGVRIGF